MSDPASAAQPRPSVGVLSVVAGVVIGAALGAYVGVLGCFVHAAGPTRIGGVVVASGLLAALALVLALLAGLRLALDRTVALGGAVGVLGAIAVLSVFPGATGSVLVQTDPAGWFWLVGAGAIAVVVPALPRRKRGGAAPTIEQ